MYFVIASEAKQRRSNLYGIRHCECRAFRHCECRAFRHCERSEAISTLRHCECVGCSVIVSVGRSVIVSEAKQSRHSIIASVQSIRHCECRAFRHCERSEAKQSRHSIIASVERSVIASAKHEAILKKQ